VSGKVYLETDRLILRRFTGGDVDNLVELDSDPEVTRYLTRAMPVREEVATRTIPWMLAYYDEHPGYGTWAAIEKASHQFIGWFHLRPAHDDGREDEPELGYRLRRSSWGNGFATEASRALIGKAFSELGARRVFALTMAVNAGSRRVMEKAGMRHIRTFTTTWPEKLDGDEEGDVEYAITRQEWESSQRPVNRLRDGRGGT
jgi:RimJ/RimL family protein N-acetyltransferase